MSWLNANAGISGTELWLGIGTVITFIAALQMSYYEKIKYPDCSCAKCYISVVAEHAGNFAQAGVICGFLFLMFWPLTVSLLLGAHVWTNWKPEAHRG